MAEATQQEQQAQPQIFSDPHDVLAYYQMRLRVPKDQTNDRLRYSYRNMEGINDALKPIQTELWETYGILTSFYFERDVVETIEGRLWRTVVPVLHTPYGDVKSKLQVREPENRSNMDPSQTSGAASSYAKKYAASDLFSIGGEADPDELGPGTEYPDGEFEATCRGCGKTYSGFTRENVEAIQCPNCKTVGKWTPVHK